MPRLLPLLASVLALAACAAPSEPAESAAGRVQQQEDAALRAAVGADWRAAEHRARDAWRHPYETLRFWGLKPGMTVVEIDPGGEAWWTHILAPYAARTGGRYVAGYVDLANPQVSEAARTARRDFEAEFGDHARYGDVGVVNFGMTSGLGVEPGSADLIIVARAFHNWATREGVTDRYMAEFYKALKPGGVLGVEQHRAPGDGDLMTWARNGYVPDSYVIQAAQKAGFVLDAKSEINANPADTKDHPFGVWTLPPVRRTAPQGQPANPAFDRSRWEAIGESDRMTLRFRKPA